MMEEASGGREQPSEGTSNAQQPHDLHILHELYGELKGMRERAALSDGILSEVVARLSVLEGSENLTNSARRSRDKSHELSALDTPAKGTPKGEGQYPPTCLYYSIFGQCKRGAECKNAAAHNVQAAERTRKWLRTKLDEHGPRGDVKILKRDRTRDV